MIKTLFGSVSEQKYREMVQKLQDSFDNEPVPSLSTVSAVGASCIKQTMQFHPYYNHYSFYVDAFRNMMDTPEHVKFKCPVCFSKTNVCIDEWASCQKCEIRYMTQTNNYPIIKIKSFVFRYDKNENGVYGVENISFTAWKIIAPKSLMKEIVVDEKQIHNMNEMITKCKTIIASHLFL